ncbi:serine hydrolase [Streptosporangium carneum]|uniref:serine hydrolase n=1 Tax=Streptosporangium carneum TaxID=47481 RepID=UPI0022F2D25F|nr:serine hydrolase [Streptosporangium carneum]
MTVAVPRSTLSPFIPAGTSPPTSATWPADSAAAQETASPEAPPKVAASKLTRALDRFLARHGGRVTAGVRDLSTGRVYTYRRDLRLPTASTSKVNILMALLLRTPWRKLDEQDRADARMMIRFSDNAAADRLYERIGLESGLARANRRFGLRNTYAPPGRCVDLYCWGITQTSAADQIRLIRALVRGGSPLAEDERERVLHLMARVSPEQSWGISAAACEGSRVSLKNGWLHHVANGRWVVVSAGLIREAGHDYAVAVLTEDSLSMDVGVAEVEGTARRILAAFRGERGCAAGEDQDRPVAGVEDQTVLSTSR